LSLYEIAVLYHPDLEIDLDKASQKITKIITDNDGKITATDNWGKRKLAYKIKDHDHAVYVFYTAELPSEAVRKVEQTLNIADEVIRFLITKSDLKAVAKAEAHKAARARRNASREAAAKTETTDEEETKADVSKVSSKVSSEGE
jgi:small subunit ribosomal protein S6